MILNGQQGISANTALRLARYFGTTPQLWMNLQKTWELRRAKSDAGREIVERVMPRQSVAWWNLDGCSSPDPSVTVGEISDALERVWILHRAVAPSISGVYGRRVRGR